MFIETLIVSPIVFLRVVIIVIISISLHEIAHGLVALSQGDDTPCKQGHITLNPLVHMGWESLIFLCVAGIAWGKMPINASNFRSQRLGNILVSTAGPLCNLVLAFLCMGLLKLLADSTYAEFFSFQFFYMSAHINLMLFLFNLLPIPPLDGFYIFSEIFPILKPLQYTYFGLFALMMLFLIPEFGDGLSAIAVFILQTVL
ncbi:site-2 protease family protein [Fischerella thermalis CCMEE 5273]|jgi:Zn-dependent protease|uniref:Peptidase M50 n=2 Tax=Fischerella TaxID=1190 RepID=G6FMR6_9CYAN|nr:site-2 protease family protein [Fischerella thermalis]PMB08991.1 site-2 protease family protein [Fischerella thermalis CCMEE 5273]EHC19346.1 peptidase M50 [Fischerella thermalis JSC-11]PLZ13227.1 site-2 protease family protein [Fischerella thermalis WC114]PLZ13568.1 site-2 protease family protein [Fischerella thermalis WC119]PLZ19268.1 site-2 protease family protein [Fischerella thermalis WC341]